jgi:hypothetical protein
MPVLIGYPRAWSTQRSGLAQLCDALTFGQVARSAEPFAPPDPILEVAGNLTFHRILGVDRAEDRPPPGLPLPLIAGAYQGGRSMAWAVESDGSEARISVGFPPGYAQQFASSLFAMTGGRPPVRVPPPVRHTGNWHFGCVFGFPGADAHRGDAGTSPLDLLLDSLRGTPFLYLVYATPENASITQQTVGDVRAATEAIERSHLKLEGIQDVDRQALRARDLLEGTERKLEHGFADGLWRATVLLGSPDPGAAEPTLAVLCGMLRPEPEDVLVPLRCYPCSDNGEYSVHGNLWLSRELSAFCSLPQRDRTGFSVGWNMPCDVNHAGNLGLVVGEILDQHQPTGKLLRVPPIQLCRHALVAGLTGSGKSTTVRALLSSVADSSIPFLVLDPVKPAAAEYAVLAERVPELSIFRVGVPPASGEAPFLFNPFAFPDGFALSTHIDYLKATFTAAFGLFPPTPYLLESAIYRVYERCGWDLATGSYPGGIDRLSWPTLSDLLGVIDEVVAEAGYGDEISHNLRAALRTRVGNLCIGPKGLALDTRENVPDALLFDSPVVLELMGLGSQEEQAFVMGLVLTRLMQVRQVAGIPASEELRHVTVIEEAHRLLKATIKGSQEDSNMAHHAVETFATMIAEVRAYGESIVVTEQIPSTLASNVVKQCSLKIIHRLTPKDDRDLVGDSMVLDVDQKRLLAVLERGRAVVHAEGMDGAIHVAVRRPVSRGRGPSLADLRSRAKAHLPHPIQRRFDRAIRRREWDHVLRVSEVRAAADAAVAISSAGRATTVARLDSAVGRMAANATPSGRSAMVDAALDDALTRRVLHGRGGETQLETARKHLGAGHAALWRWLASQRFSPAGRHRWCARCPQICRWSYEGDLLGADDFLLQDLDYARNGPRHEWEAEATGALTAAVERMLEGLGKPPPALAWCAGCRALTNLGTHAVRLNARLGFLFT